MYKEIQKEDVVRTLETLKENFKNEISGAVGEENAEKLVSGLVILPDVYAFLPFAEFLSTLEWNEYALFTYEARDILPPIPCRG